MKRINTKIEGISPLLCNRFTDAAQMSATSGNSSSHNGDRGSPREIAEPKLYIGLDGNPMIPQPNVLRCIIDGGTFFKTGRSKVTTQKSSLLAACVAIDEIEIPIIHKEDWTVDTRAVRIPATGGRILAHRPCFHDWSLAFTIELDEEIIGLRLLRDIIDASGKRVGLGDFRPATKGPFGRFVVTHWEEEI